MFFSDGGGPQFHQLHHGRVPFRADRADRHGPNGLLWNSGPRVRQLRDATISVATIRNSHSLFLPFNIGNFWAANLRNSFSPYTLINNDHNSQRSKISPILIFSQNPHGANYRKRFSFFFSQFPPAKEAVFRFRFYSLPLSSRTKRIA